MAKISRDFLYQIIDKAEGKTDNDRYTFKELVEFFKPSESDLEMDPSLQPLWEKITSVVSLNAYLKELGQQRYDIKCVEEMS